MNVTALPRHVRQSADLRTARVVEFLNGQLLLDDGSHARVASSCFLQPEVGDWVCYVEADECYVVHVLRRPEHRRSAEVALPDIDELRVSTKEIAIAATRRLHLSSLVDCELLAATGRLSFTAQNIVSTAANSMFQIARHVVAQAESISQRATHLFSAHARRHLIVAEKEVRVDGELIQMG